MWARKPSTGRSYTDMSAVFPLKSRSTGDFYFYFYFYVCGGVCFSAVSNFPAMNTYCLVSQQVIKKVLHTHSMCQMPIQRPCTQDCATLRSGAHRGKSKTSRCQECPELRLQCNTTGVGRETGKKRWDRSLQSSVRGWGLSWRRWEWVRRFWDRKWHHQICSW